MLAFRALALAALLGYAALLGHAAAADVAAQAKSVAAITPPAIVPSSMVAGHFRLTAADGTVVDSDALSGKPYGLFFGFTRCPDFCPTTLSDLTVAMKRLPATAGDFHVYFVTIDPDRDTPAVLKSYMESFGPQLVALSGDQPATDEAIRGFGVVARRVELPHDDYTYGHSASIYLINGDGLIVDRVGADKGPEALAHKLAAFLAPPATPASQAP